MSTNELRCRVHDDICAKIDWLKQIRRRKRIVDDQWYFMVMRDFSQLFKIEKIDFGIAD